MVIAIVGLWVAWMRNAKRQHRLQRMLADTSRQLQEASCHLEEAMLLIRELGQAKNMVGHDDTSGRAISPRGLSNHPAGGDTTVAQVLRMRREGHDAEEIAAQLDTPPAQVRLLLKLHAAGDHAHEKEKNPNRV